MLWKFKLKKQNLIEFLIKMLLPRDVLQLIENLSNSSSNYRSSTVYILYTETKKLYKDQKCKEFQI